MTRIERIALGDEEKAASIAATGRRPGPSCSTASPASRTPSPSPASRSCSNANASNFGVDVRHARRVPRPPRAQTWAPMRSSPKFRAACAAEVRDAVVAVFGAPPVDGLGTAGGFKIIVEDRGGSGLEVLAAADRRRRSPRATRRPGWSGCSQLPGQHAAAVRGRRPDQVQGDGRGAQRRLRPRCRSTSARYYVNDFNRFGRTWQVNVQADAPLPQAGRRRPAAQGPQRQPARWCRWARSPRSSDVGGPVMVIALQHVPRGRGQRRRGAGRQLRPGASTPWRSRPTRSCPPAMAFEWTELAYLQIQAGNTAMIVFALGGGAGVPGAGGAVRELVAAAGRHPRRADVPALLGRRRADRRDGHQHLHADRLRRAGRPGEQERHPDRRVRQGRARGRASRGSRRRSRRAGCGCGRS